MSYRTVDEAQNFDFRDAEIIEIKRERDHLFLHLGYVTILPENSCNRDIRKMGTKELMLQLQHAQINRFVEEGYKLYDADGKLTDTIADREVPQESGDSLLEELAQGAVYSLERRDSELPGMAFAYEICIDANDRTYLLQVSAKHDVEEWERFMNRDSGC